MKTDVESPVLKQSDGGNRRFFQLSTHETKSRGHHIFPFPHQLYLELNRLMY